MALFPINQKKLAARIAVYGAIIFLGFSGASQSFAEPKGIELNENGFTSSKVCAKCHSQIFKTWKESMHAMSTSDPIFRASYMEAHYKSGGKAEQICLRCHAPTTKFTHGYNLDVGATSEGLTCDFCHSLKDVDLSNQEYPFILDLGLTKYGPNKGGKVKVHKVAYSPLHLSSKICASCHEYTPNGLPVMSTYSEWKKSVYAEENKPCQSCHMPKMKADGADSSSKPGEKVVSHKLAGGLSIIQLEKAIDLKIASVQRGKDRITVNVNVTNRGSGHRVPTGMSTRKLMLYCEVRISGGKVYRDKVVYEKVIFDKDGFELTRDADIMLGMGTSIAKDNRIFPKETRKERFVFYLPANQKANISVWIDYLYQPVIMQKTDMRIEINRDRAVISAGEGTK